MYSRAFKAFRTLFPLVLGIAILAELMSQTIPETVGWLIAYSFFYILVTILLAFEFHKHLLGTHSDSSLKRRNSWPFVWRSLCLFFAPFTVFLLSLAIPPDCYYAIFGQGFSPNFGTTNLEFTVFLFLLLTPAALTFAGLAALFGTSLPAAVLKQDFSFRTAYHRSSKTFGITFLRILIGPVLVSAILFGSEMLIDFNYSDLMRSTLKDSIPSFVFAVTSRVFDLFSPTLTATALCMTYETAEA